MALLTELESVDVTLLTELASVDVRLLTELESPAAAEDSCKLVFKKAGKSRNPSRLLPCVAPER